MKKIKTKLSLSTETIRVLSGSALRHAAGGDRQASDTSECVCTVQTCVTRDCPSAPRICGITGA